MSNIEMTQSEVIERLENVLSLPCTVDICGEGCSFALTIISDAFEGLSQVKRQQLVYKAFSSDIASGRLHAISMTTLTNKESIS